ncbi:peroxisomal N(1)-acetyl-spermine/spermidine oxidase [Strongylocentrotus purpuratus]|uniref:Amine oxidase domain-containing protein n=1 Tax=Strongylocentrotus purpuratus TaxID=7668 RepID=A0A7M7SZ37_STRPU|nr:peroxisomal N(1)-acetyl-spermine/spermidine oxidase [Strongylocentrotus purpuratus]
MLRSKESEDVDIEVTVLEAMDRPGGRAVTLQFADGLVEGGAQYIHGCEGNPVYQRAQQSHAADFGEYKEILGNVTFADGYNQFVETFLKNIPPESLVFSKPVQQVAWNHVKEDNSKGKPITITCTDGDKFEADYVINTTSLGYLKENARTMFCPPLPTPKLDLISRMGFGTAGKIWLEYKTPFWAENWGGIYLVWDAKPRDVLVDEFKEKEWYKHFYAIHSIQDKPKLLMVWMYGRSAEYIETLDNDTIAKTLTGVLREFLKNPTIPVPEQVHKTQWHSNPYVRGSYSYVAAGSCGADIDALAEPVYVPGKNGLDQPAICFAGEATHRTFYSTTHGAMLSGQREAERIIRDVELRATPKPTVKDDGNIPKRTSVDVLDRIENLTL